MDIARLVLKGLALVFGLLLIAGGGLVGLCGAAVHAGQIVVLGLVPCAIGLGIVILAARRRREPPPPTAPENPSLPERAP